MAACLLYLLVPQIHHSTSYSIHPTCINDNGVVVGYYGDSTGAHGFIYNNGAFTTVNSPNAGNGGGGDVGTFLSGINNLERLLGIIMISNNIEHGFTG